MKISLYSFAYKIIENPVFDIEAAIKNWSKYCDEIIISTASNDCDGTKEELKRVQESKIVDTPIFIVEDNIDFEDLTWDGKVKNLAHKSCNNNICISIDLDERIGGSPKLWKQLAEKLQNSSYDCLMLPSVDLHGSYYTYKNINTKWYLIKRDGVSRGVCSLAIKNGEIDFNKSDSTEPIKNNGELASLIDVCHSNGMERIYWCRSGNPFVWHLGYLDLNKRVKINNNFWDEKWIKRNTGKETKLEDLEKAEVFEHNIELDFLDTE